MNGSVPVGVAAVVTCGPAVLELDPVLVGVVDPSVLSGVLVTVVDEPSIVVESEIVVLVVGAVVLDVEVEVDEVVVGATVELVVEVDVDVEVVVVGASVVVVVVGASVVVVVGASVVVVVGASVVVVVGASVVVVVEVDVDVVVVGASVVVVLSVVDVEVDVDVDVLVDVEVEVVTGVQLDTRSTEVVRVATTLSGHEAVTLSVTVPVDPPGTVVVADVDPLAGTSIAYPVTANVCTPSVAVASRMSIDQLVSLFPIDQVMRWSPSEHTV